MSTDTLKIEIPEGHEVDTFDTKTGVIKFKEKPKSIFERIKTDEDVLKYHELSMDEFLESCKGLRDHEIAFRFLELVVESLNEGWEPDWEDSDQWKYEPYFKGGSSGFRFYDHFHWATFSTVGSRLCLKSSDLAKHAGTHFTDWYKRVIIKS